MEIKELDARGLSCPEPVMMIRRAMQSGDAVYEMRVDHVAAKENVTRYAERMGYTVTTDAQGGEYVLHMRREDSGK